MADLGHVPQKTEDTDWHVGLVFRPIQKTKDADWHVGLVLRPIQTEEALEVSSDDKCQSPVFYGTPAVSRPKIRFLSFLTLLPTSGC